MNTYKFENIQNLNWKSNQIKQREMEKQPEAATGCALWKKCVLRNFTKFTGKTPAPGSLF